MAPIIHNPVFISYGASRGLLYGSYAVFGSLSAHKRMVSFEVDLGWSVLYCVLMNECIFMMFTYNDGPYAQTDGRVVETRL